MSAVRLDYGPLLPGRIARRREEARTVMNAFPPLTIAGIEISPPLALAPMAGVTNALFRKLFKPFGFGLTVSEFVSAQSLIRMNRRTLEMIDVYADERPTSVQLHGNDPAVMAQAAAFVEECGADIVDINFGCPAPKIVKGGDGAAILRDPDLAVAICAAVRKAVKRVPVTVKMRLGWHRRFHPSRALRQTVLQAVCRLVVHRAPQRSRVGARHRQRRHRVARRRGSVLS
jgi:tRNA-dihydrouridine synthase B